MSKLRDSTLVHALSVQFVSGDVEHLLAQVDTGHLVSALREEPGMSARPATEIEQGGGRVVPLSDQRIDVIDLLVIRLVLVEQIVILRVLVKNAHDANARRTASHTLSICPSCNVRPFGT